jgi:hypothetical protein
MVKRRGSAIRCPAILSPPANAQPQIPRGAQMPGPPRIPSNVGQQASPSSHGLSVPVTHSHPADRHPLEPQAPLAPQNPEQQPTQCAPHAQNAGQATASALQIPPKHWLGGTHVPDPPGRLMSSGQHTSPATHEPETLARQRQPSSAHGRICAPMSDPPRPIPTPATTAAPTTRPMRPSTPRRESTPASRLVKASNRFCSTRHPPPRHERSPRPSPTPRALQAPSRSGQRGPKLTMLSPPRTRPAIVTRNAPDPRNSPNSTRGTCLPNCTNPSSTRPIPRTAHHNHWDSSKPRPRPACPVTTHSRPTHRCRDVECQWRSRTRYRYS